MILDTLFALTKLGYLFAMWQVVAISTQALVKGQRFMPLSSFAILIFLSQFSV